MSGMSEILNAFRWWLFGGARGYTSEKLPNGTYLHAVLRPPLWDRIYNKYLWGHVWKYRNRHRSTGQCEQDNQAGVREGE